MFILYVQSFKPIAKTVKEVDYTISTSYSSHFSNHFQSLKRQVFGLNDFTLPKEVGAHLQYVSSICGKFQCFCYKALKGVAYLILTSCISHSS